MAIGCFAVVDVAGAGHDPGLADNMVDPLGVWGIVYLLHSPCIDDMGGGGSKYPGESAVLVVDGPWSKYRLTFPW